jgi:DNA-binding LacI/PurR family transcriptional regulator
MGYMPDPMLSALNAYRHASRASQYHGTVAWITNHPDRDGWRTSYCYHLYFEGAREQLTRHGYKLEEFWLREPGLSARRASQVLLNRGIRGLLICPLPISRGHLSLQWEKFSALTFGYSLVRPKLHLFTAAHYRAISACVRELRTRGYRRIGMVTSYKMNQRMDRMWTAAYNSEIANLPNSQTIPNLLLGETPTSDKNYRKLVVKWFRTYKPDAIVTPEIPVFEWLTEEGHRVPRDVTVANASIHKEGLVSGIIEPSREIGRAAADFLVGMLQRGEYGIPSTPQRILLEGTWYAGSTVGMQKPPASAGKAR